MKKTVLVIDNDANAASLISKTLEAEGYLVFTASSGDMALTMAKKVTPLLVFLNLATPGTNGLEICKSIRSIGPLKNVPLVLLTLRESKFDPRYKTLYGIVGFLRKPFASSDITSMVGSILSHDAAVAAEAFPEPPKEEGFMESDTAGFDSGRHEPVSVSNAFNAYEMPEETIHEEIMPEGITLEETVFEEPAFKPQETFSMPVKEKPPVKESPQPFKAGTEESSGFQISGDKGLGDPFKEKLPGGDFSSETIGMSSAAAGEKTYGQEKKLKTTNRMIMPVAAVAAGVIALVAYMFLKPVATAPGRKPAGTVIAKNMPSKPLKKPQAFLPSITPMVEAALEKPKPAEKIKPPAAKPLPIAYFVQFGVFTVEQNANAFQQELKAKGQEASIHQSAIGGKPAYRV
ncbi:MAG: response regulator, partial [Thermodesulfovibrionales bacterium]|nr:response regulator [Thermodesulfovibrionales bacterium]